jgi:hypothetical protein
VALLKLVSQLKDRTQRRIQAYIRFAIKFAYSVEKIQAFFPKPVDFGSMHERNLMLPKFLHGFLMGILRSYSSLPERHSFSFFLIRTGSARGTGIADGRRA